jgi:hypothetical protein
LSERDKRSSLHTDDNIAFAQMVEHPVQLRPVAPSAGGLLFVDPGAASSLEGAMSLALRRSRFRRRDDRLRIAGYGNTDAVGSIGAAKLDRSPAEPTSSKRPTYRSSSENGYTVAPTRNRATDRQNQPWRKLGNLRCLHYLPYRSVVCGPWRIAIEFFRPRRYRCARHGVGRSGGAPNARQRPFETRRSSWFSSKVKTGCRLPAHAAPGRG